MSTTYNATITLDTRDDVDDDLIDALVAYHPATGRTPTGHVEVIITLPAENLAQLAQTTVVLLTAATDTPILSLELMRTDEFDRRVGLAPVPDLVSVTEAAALAGVSRQAILQRLEAGTLAGAKIGATWAVQREHLTGHVSAAVTSATYEGALVDGGR